MYSGDYTINHNENYDQNVEKVDHIDTIKVDVGLDMGTNIVNIKSVSAWWCFYALSNT